MSPPERSLFSRRGEGGGGNDFPSVLKDNQERNFGAIIFYSCNLFSFTTSVKNILCWPMTSIFIALFESELLFLFTKRASFTVFN